MELIAIWHVIKRRWWLIMLPAVIVLVLTLPTLKNVVSPPISYLVQMRFTAAAPPEAALESMTTPYEDTVYVPLLASEYVVVNMSHWITGDAFAGEVSQELSRQDVIISVDELKTTFHADSFRSILTLYVAWDDPDSIRPIANAAITVLQTRNQTYFPQFAAELVQVVPLDDIEVDTLAPPITTRFAPLMRVLMGLMAGVCLAIVAEYLDTSLRTRTEVEALGLAVLAEIPAER